MSSPRLNPRPLGGRLPRLVASLAVALLLVAVLLLAGAGPAYRMGLFALGDAFATLRYGAYTAIGGAGLGLVILVIAAWRRHVRHALLGGLVVIVSAALVSVPLSHLQRAQEVPPIHDITTDTQDPPAFTALAPAREAAPNAVDYPGEATARQQREAYPDLAPLVLQAPLSTVLAAAQAEVREAGWELAAVNGTRLEATATTTWFGFKDDVVIRLTETAEGVRVDMRSASRLGRSDVGTNAARIRAFLAALERRVGDAAG